MPLPPLGVDTYRKWAADRWRGVTDATIGRVQSGLWDVQATSAIDALGQQLAQMRAQEQARQEAQRQQEVERRRREEEEAVRRREALSATAQGAAGAIGERLGAGISGVGATLQRSAQAVQGAATDWSSRADAAIDDLGGAVAEFGESPSGQYLQEPLKPARATLGAMGEAYQRGQAAAPGVLGAGLGALGAFPAGFEQLGEQAALGAGFTPEQAAAQGRLAGIVSPGLGGYEQGAGGLGQLATAGLGAIGAARGALETEGGLGERAGGALEGGLNWAQFGQPVGAVADLVRGVPYAFGRARGALDDLAQRYGTPPDDTLGAVGRGAAARRPASASESGLVPREFVEPAGGWRDPRTGQPLVDPATGAPVRPPAQGQYVTKNEYNYWLALERGRNPFVSSGRGPKDPSKPFYRWDLFAEPPPLGPGGTKPGRMNLEPLPPVDWDAELTVSNGGRPWSYGVTGPDTVQEMLRLYDDEDIPMEAAAARLGLSGAQGRAAVKDAKAAINRLGPPYKKTGNEWTAAGAERDVGKFGYTSSQPDAVPHRYDSAYEVAAAMRLDELVEQGAIRGWRKGGGKRARVRFVIDPARAFHPATNPGGILDAGREAIYSPDFLVDLNDGTQGMVEVKNLGAMGQDPWKVEEKADFARQVFDRWGMPFEVWAEDQIGRPFMRRVGTATPASLPPGHPLLRMPASERAKFQGAMREATVAAQAPAFREAGTQHLLDFNAANPYPRIPGDAAADLEAVLPAVQAQVARHNALDAGGSTFTPAGVDAAVARAAGGEGGYMVSIAPERALAITGRHDLQPVELARFVVMNEDLLEAFPGRLNIGTWKTTAVRNGVEVPQVVVDLSLRVDDEETARQIGNLYRQKAVYNVDDRVSTPLAKRFWASTKLPVAEREDELHRILALAAAAAERNAGRAGVGGRVPGVGAPVPGAAGRPGALAGAGDAQPGAGAPRGAAAPPLAPDGGAGLRLGRAGGPGGAAAPDGAGLGAAYQRAVDALAPAGAAATRGQRAFDVATGTAGGALAAGTAEEDATWQERAGRFALGSAAGALVGPTGRSALGTLRGGTLGRNADVLGAAAGARQPALPGMPNPPAQRDLLGDVTTVGTGLGLANPASLAANLTGGLMRTATRVARELAGETGNPLHAFEDVVGMALEVPRALRRLPRSVWEGPTPQARALTGASIGSGLENRQNLPALVGTFGTRANAATDQLIRAINEAGASRVARARGRTGIERARDVQRAGEFATYQSGKSSPLADLMSQSRSWLSDPQASAAQRLAGGVLYGFAPYVRMPERLLVESLKTITDPVTQALPLVQALRKGDKAAMREARARIAVGASATALFYSLWRDGGLTGDAPTDPTERRRREAEGAEWNTVRIGDRAIPLRFLGDLGQSASAVASTLDGAKAAMDAGKDPGQVFEAGANEALRWVLSESYLRDLARFGGDVLEGRGANTLERIAAGTVTRPAAALAPLAAADPYEREAEGFVGQAMARVPGLRQGLPERIDPLTGEPQRRAGTGASRALGQYGSDLSPEGRELARLKVNPRTFGPTEQYAGAAQTPAQRRALQRAYGSESGKAVRDTLASDAYKKADDAGKKRQLEKALREAAADADVVAGANVARGPKERAEYEYLAVPQFEGVRGSADEVRRQNLAIRRARALRSEYRGRYPNDPDKGEGEFYREHRKEYTLAQRPALPPEELRRRRQQIEDKLGVTAP